VQIGPRIRVGGTLGKAGQAVKAGVGKALSNKYVDVGLSLIPGVGPGLAAAANAAGHVLDTSGGGIHSLSDIGRIGLDAGSTYGLSRLAGTARGGLGSLLNGGASAPPPPIPTDAPWLGGAAAEDAGALPGGPTSLIDKGLNVGKGILGFAEEHPNAVGSALQGIGGIASSGTENRLRNAQAEELQAQTANLKQQGAQTSYDLMRRKLQDQRLAPIWGALNNAPMHGGYADIARNPYSTGG
jgi:hypothetical protein